MSIEVAPQDFSAKHLEAEFHKQGLAQLDNRLIDEKFAKEGLLVGLVTGLNPIFVGEPGGGKTTLAEEAYRLVGDVTSDQVARVPHHSDLSPQQLIGGSVRTSRETVVDGVTKVESIFASIEPIIKEDTKVIWIDELNRVNPFAVNAVLGALENGRVTTDAGQVTLRGLLMAVSTMNPSETRQATFPVSAATASRHAIGAIMGGEKSNRRNTINEIFANSWEPGAISPVISTEDLLRLRAKATTIPVAESVAGPAVDLIMRTADELSNNHMHEADPRIAKHIGKISRGLALLRSEDSVTNQDVLDAVRYVVTARLGTLSTSRSSTTAANLFDHVDDIYKKITRTN